MACTGDASNAPHHPRDRCKAQGWPMPPFVGQREVLETGGRTRRRLLWDRLHPGHAVHLSALSGAWGAQWEALNQLGPASYDVRVGGGCGQRRRLGMYPSGGGGGGDARYDGGEGGYGNDGGNPRGHSRGRGGGGPPPPPGPPPPNAQMAQMHVNQGGGGGYNSYAQQGHNGGGSYEPRGQQQVRSHAPATLGLARRRLPSHTRVGARLTVRAPGGECHRAHCGWMVSYVSREQASPALFHTHVAPPDRRTCAVASPGVRRWRLRERGAWRWRRRLRW
jgi:hypothetical protein